MKQLKFSVFLAFFLLGISSQAQILKDTISNYDPTNPSHLIVEYEEAQQSLLMIRNKLTTGFNIDPIKNDYQNIQSRLNIYRQIGESHLDMASLSHMNDLILIFERQLKVVEGWETNLVEITKALSDFRVQLFKHKDRLTMDQTGFTEIQQQYYNTRHVPLINQVDSVNLLVDQKLEEVLELEFSISKEYALLYNRLQHLKAEVADYWDNLMKKEEINWRLGFSEELVDESGRILSSTTWRILDFFKINFDRVLLLTVILIGTFLFLTKLQKQEAKKPDSQQDHLLYQSPKASSLLLAGLLFPVVFPPTTSLMYDFALLISYIPFMFILRNTLDRRSFRVYLVFFIFLLLLKVQGVFSTNSGFLAIITMLAGAVFIFTISSQTLRTFFKIRWKWVSIFNWILVGLTATGILCILLQRVRLGNILINGSGETIALGLILFYFANWSDHFIGYIKQLPRFRNLAKNKKKLDEFWHTWSNRIYLLLLLTFTVAFLKNFGLYTAAKGSFFEFFETERVLGELTFTYGGIALFLIVIYLATKISSTIKFLTEDKSYYKSIKQTANMAVIFRFFLITVGFLLALLVSGIPLDRITIILGALSVGIGFGLQSVVNNLISGIILIFERPVQTGDLVELQQYTGFIKDIGIRSSVIRTYEGAEVIVPNANLITQEVINWTLSNRERRVEMRVGVAYGSNVEQVIEVISKVLKEHNKVENYPAPAVLLDGFGDSSVDFRCLIWTTDIDNWLKIKSELSTSIYNALNEANITIPFPQRDLHVISWKAGPPEQKTNSKPDPSIPEAENDQVGPGIEASGTEGD